MVFEYRCEKCNKVFEVELPFGEHPQKLIPCKCNGLAKRVWSVSIHIPSHMKATGDK